MITNRKWEPKDHVYGNRWLPKCAQRPYLKFSVKDFQMTNLVGDSNDPNVAAVRGDHTAGAAAVIGQSNEGRCCRIPAKAIQRSASPGHRAVGAVEVRCTLGTGSSPSGVQQELRVPNQA